MSVPTLRLDGQAAVITGGSAGLGIIMCRALVEQGAAVLIAARREEPMRALAAELAEAGGRVAHRVSDVRDPSHAEDLVAECVRRFGRIDGVIANAGVADSFPAAEHDSARFDDVLSVNVTAGAALAGVLADRLIAQERPGWVILLSSILGRRAGTTAAGVSAYAASKGAVEQLTRELARQWGPHGIRVNALAPGVFQTDMNRAMIGTPERRARTIARIPQGRLGEPEDLAGAVAFLASDAARYVTGQILPVDGGMSIW